MTIKREDFTKVELRVGTIIEAMDFPEARNPAIKMKIDFGAKIGVKKSSAQITTHYTPQKLIGKQIVAVTNFGPKQIGPRISEVLVTGFHDEEDGVVLVSPDSPIPNGTRLM